MGIKRFITALLVSMFLTTSSAYALLPAYNVKAPVFRGDYSVTLAKDNPVAATVSSGDHVNVAIYEFYTKKDVVLKQMSFKVNGLIDPSEVKAIYVMDASKNLNAVLGWGPSVDAYGYSVVDMSTVLSPQSFQRIKVKVELADDVTSGATFSVGLVGLKVTDGITGNVAKGSYNLSKLVSNVFSIVSTCTVDVLKGPGAPNTIVNGNDVHLLTVVITPHCNGDFNIESMTFDVANNPTASKITKFSLYDSTGNSVSGIGGGVGDDYITTAFSDYNNLLEYSHTTSYKLKADIQGLNYSNNEMIYVRLGSIILKNVVTDEVFSFERGVDFGEISNTLFY